VNAAPPPAPPFPDTPSRLVRSPDGATIAVFSAGSGPPIVVVHGVASDHRTWRVVGPGLAERFTLHAIDRRGRGDSGDGPGYALEQEFEDLAAVAETLATGRNRHVDVVGHSLGGRIALGASLRTGAIGRLVVYEGAPPPAGRADAPERLELLAHLRGDLARGDLAGLLARFMRASVGMTEGDLDRFRADPVWPLRVASAPTIVRELEGIRHPDAGLDHLGAVSVPVLQLLGSDSKPAFRSAAEALHARLAHGSLRVIEGARHAAHHTHPEAFIAAVAGFLKGE
jgi:pimeloyl-ACP methyl ester carboxylesterase